MSLINIIKQQASNMWQYIIKNIKAEDVFGIYKAMYDIMESCKQAKSNNVCLGDCVHCEHLANKIKEITK